MILLAGTFPSYLCSTSLVGKAVLESPESSALTLRPVDPAANGVHVTDILIDLVRKHKGAHYQLLKSHLFAALVKQNAIK